MSEWLGWWFAPNDRRLANGDRREIKIGETLTVSGEIIPCQNGLHASRKAMDALLYAPGEAACWVRLSGVIVEESDKAAASDRTVLAIADVGDLLHEFACWCAEQALLREQAQGREPDPRCWTAIDAKRQWLKGDITDQQLLAAQAAAKAAAWATNWPTYRAAAGAVVWATDWPAAMVAAWATDWPAAKAAVWATDWPAAVAAAWATDCPASRAAAGAVVWATDWAAQNEELENRMEILLGLND